MMTVKELKESLKEYDENMKVEIVTKYRKLADSYSVEYSPVHHVTTVAIGGSSRIVGLITPQ